MQIYTLDLHFLNRTETIAAFLIEHEGQLALVESGPHSTFEALKEAVAAVGYDYRDVKTVFLSHIHFDHAGAAWALAREGATIYVHPAGLKHLHDPSRLYASAKMIYGDKMEFLWGEMHGIAMDQLYAPTDGEEIDFAGLAFRALHTPGHAVHHIAWQVGDTIFAGDVAGVKIGEGPVVPPCPPPDIHIEDWLVSLQKLRLAAPARLLLTHYGEVTDIEQHLKKLEEALAAWSGWMYGPYKAGQSAEEITPLFVEFVRESLRKEGVSEGQLAQYEGANPPNMSVAGLLRYWKKKEEVC